MSKVITSPVKKWPGTVTLSDPMNYPQFFAVQDAMAEGNRLAQEAREAGKEISEQRYSHTILGGVLQCIEAHDLKGLPEVLTLDNFPSSPAASSLRLIAWLINEVTEIYTSEDESPNE
jgi:hypothetical protein